jgi:hypothetical protein
VALLTEPKFSDMFWYWWRIEPLSDNPDERAAVLSTDFWRLENLSTTQFIDREFGIPADAFWGGTGFRDGRILMRGLYLGVPAHWWDRWMVWILLKLGC